MAANLGETALREVHHEGLDEVCVLGVFSNQT